MTNPTIRIHNAETNEIIDREMTAEELLNYEAAQAKNLELKTEADAKATARREILDRLGLTADEAALLLG